ncbi:MAG TPA: hypothetical protein VNO32_55825 [Candidatus Acidoferrum sp.]|nr:hypothetical protein [Candidatus Acidoferrum sp.]
MAHLGRIKLPFPVRLAISPISAKSSALTVTTDVTGELKKIAF